MTEAFAKYRRSQLAELADWHPDFDMTRVSISEADKESGSPKLGEIRWESPGFEDSYQAFRYWDSPTDDGKVWECGDITHWMPLPQPPKEQS